MYFLLIAILVGMSIFLLVTKNRKVAEDLSTLIASDCIITEFLVLANLITSQVYSKPTLVLIPLLIIVLTIDVLSLVRELDPGSHF